MISIINLKGKNPFGVTIKGKLWRRFDCLTYATVGYSAARGFGHLPKYMFPKRIQFTSGVMI